ncbi:FkbM family methyltransferase [Symmachiella dynata]|uniref:FkbM family methyltransferase n=1 Tax=Symmachiella dynata TaxID=2527995 RepID=UPI0030EE1009
MINGFARRRGYHIERIVDYTDNQLDVFELLIDQINPKDPEFFFIQVGANDGRTGDPIRKHIQNFQWRGLLLEPLPNVFTILTDNYKDHPQVILENCALAQQDGTLSIYTTPGSGQLATFDRAALERRVRDRSEIISISVRAATFQTLLNQHQINRVDLLVVDTEGFDFEVIRMALQNGLPTPPRLIRYEHLHLSTADRNACAELLTRHNYLLHREGVDTLAYRP